MKHCYKLDKEDIKKILADHFDAKEADVIVEVDAKTKGYGYGEHTVHDVSATVYKEAKEDD